MVTVERYEVNRLLAVVTPQSDPTSADSLAGVVVVMHRVGGPDSPPGTLNTTTIG